jgi:signal transduction histidine kinase/ActR/RegA family two-component response regulator
MSKQLLSVLAIAGKAETVTRIETLLRGLEHWEIAFTGTSNLDEARDYLQRRTGDLIILAEEMDSLEFVEWVAEVRQERPRRPLVVIVREMYLQRRRVLREAGASEYVLEDSLSVDSLRLAVESALHRHSQDDDKALLKAELRESQKMEAVGTLAAGIAHDFNNLLTSIKGYLQIVQQRITDPSLHKYLGNMESSCDSMAELIRRLMSFAHREETRSTRVNVKDIAKTTAIFLNHALPKNIVLQIHLADQPLYVFATSSSLQQVLLNLCVNAAEAMGDRGTLSLAARYVPVTPELQERYSMLTGLEYVLIEVGDTGPGIAPQHLDRIFEPFFTTKSLGSQKGTGLGLALVWQIVREMGGHIHVETEVGEGTKFLIFLPYSAEPPQAKEGNRRDALPGGSERILIVDDEPKILDVCKNLLESLGYEVYPAPSGREAIAIAERLGHQLSCVVLDLSMPQMDGFACYERLVALAPETTVIFASGHDVESRIHAWDSAHEYPFLQKPFGLKELAVRIREVLDRKEKQKAGLGAERNAELGGSL